MGEVKQRRIWRLHRGTAPGHANHTLVWSLGLALIVIAALVIRLTPVLQAPESYRDGRGPFGDTFMYHTIAFNVFQGHGYSGTVGKDTFGAEIEDRALVYRPAIVYPPVYPLFLAAIYKTWRGEAAAQAIGAKRSGLAPSAPGTARPSRGSHRRWDGDGSAGGRETDGPRLRSDRGSAGHIGGPAGFLPREAWRMLWHRVRIVQCVLDALVCLLVFFIVRTIVPLSRWLPLVSSALYSVSVYNIYYTRTLLRESLSAFFIAAFLLCCVRAIRHGGARRWMLTGIAFGAVNLTRTEYLPFGLALILYVVWLKRARLADAAAPVMWFLAGAAVAILPWTARNALVFRQPILITSGGMGGSVYLGMTINRENWRWWWQERYPEHLFLDVEEQRAYLALYNTYRTTLVDGTLEEIRTRTRGFLQLAGKRFRRQPAAVITHWLAKIPRLWYQNYLPFYRDPEAGGVFCLLYLLCAALAVATGPPEARTLMAPVGLLVLYLTLVFIPLHVEARYSAPVMPGLISLAGIGLGNVIGRLCARIVSAHG